MRKFLLASHSSLASGMKDSVEMILGKQDSVTTLCAYIDENVDLVKQVDYELEQLTESDELIVITDVFGGSVNNEFMKRLETHKFQLIAGMCLPLLIELITQNGLIKDTKSLIDKAIHSSLLSTQHCNVSFANNELEEEEF